MRVGLCAVVACLVAAGLVAAVPVVGPSLSVEPATHRVVGDLDGDGVAEVVTLQEEVHAPDGITTQLSVRSGATGTLRWSQVVVGSATVLPIDLGEAGPGVLVVSVATRTPATFRRDCEESGFVCEGDAVAIVAEAGPATLTALDAGGGGVWSRVVADDQRATLTVPTQEVAGGTGALTGVAVLPGADGRADTVAYELRHGQQNLIVETLPVGYWVRGIVSTNPQVRSWGLVDGGDGAVLGVTPQADGAEEDGALRATPDLTGDGQADVLIEREEALELLDGTTLGSVWAQASDGFQSPPVIVLPAGDADGDGVVDLMVIAIQPLPQTSSESLLVSGRDGRLIRRESTGVAIPLGDIDGDGDGPTEVSFVLGSRGVTGARVYDVATVDGTGTDVDTYELAVPLDANRSSGLFYIDSGLAGGMDLDGDGVRDYVVRVFGRAGLGVDGEPDCVIRVCNQRAGGAAVSGRDGTVLSTTSGGDESSFLGRGSLVLLRDGWIEIDQAGDVVTAARHVGTAGQVWRTTLSTSGAARGDVTRLRADGAFVLVQLDGGAPVVLDGTTGAVVWSGA